MNNENTVIKKTIDWDEIENLDNKIELQSEDDLDNWDDDDDDDNFNTDLEETSETNEILTSTLLSKEEHDALFSKNIIDETDIAIDIPLHRIRQLIEKEEVITIKVHNIPIFINKSTLCDIVGVSFEKINMQSVKESLEEVLSQKDVEEFRKQQTRSVSLGSEYYLVDNTPVLDLSQFTIKTPTLATKLKVEIADMDFDLEGFSLLNGVKPEFKNVAKGLEWVIKTPIAAHILNLVQEQTPQKEMEFYINIFGKLGSDSNTFSLALGMFRHLMQYALNVDTLQIKSILTEEFLKKEGG